MGFLSDIGRLYALYKEDLAKRREAEKVLAQGPTEAFIKELMRQAEPGVESVIHFPGGATMTVTRRVDAVESKFNGLTTREEF